MLSDKVNLTFFILWTSASLGKAQSPSCSYVTDSKKWTLTGVCTVTNKDERGWCQMREPFKTYTDVIGNFTSVELSNSGDYVWTCSAGLELPSSNGSYNYEVRFGEILPVWRPAFTVRIHDPGQPILKNCPEQVTEAESVTCECSSERDGEPRPVLSWSGHTDSSILRLYDVTVNETYSCEMYWGNQTRTVTYSLLVTRLCLTCSKTTNTREWSLSVFCWDMSVQSPNKCQWDVVNTKTVSRVEAPRTLPSPDKFFNCSIIFRLPSLVGDYIYRIELAVNNWTNAFPLKIDPGKPTVKNCKHEVYKGNDVECVCSTEREGSPPPAISWRGKTTSPTLRLRDVRESSTYTCEMVWGKQTKTVSYSLIMIFDLHVRTTLKPLISSGKVTSLDCELFWRLLQTLLTHHYKSLA
ncbi:uncharacterized protein LOC112568675 isoform X7 [Pomacea canaliculata]|uniref:uncharacterized protein LOC112568675 isoform X7 n=1 Tax=Pomacea canaliculata TaxID=400727 RepID=UPI000D733541|nr:uncharacterized protein LOC112568675 isoform X7 [Pomacea canaliculata]